MPLMTQGKRQNCGNIDKGSSRGELVIVAHIVIDANMLLVCARIAWKDLCGNR
jgi:hypothetical protein